MQEANCEVTDVFTQLHNLWFCKIAVHGQNFEINSCLASPMSTESEALILHVILQYHVFRDFPCEQ